MFLAFGRGFVTSIAPERGKKSLGMRFVPFAVLPVNHHTLGNLKQGAEPDTVCYSLCYKGKDYGKTPRRTPSS